MDSTGPGQASDVLPYGCSSRARSPCPTTRGAGVLLRGAEPEPARAGTRFRFKLRAGAVRLALYDARGRLVRVLAEGVRAAGEQSVDWDQRDPQGARVRGVLFARLETAAGVLARTIVAL